MKIKAVLIMLAFSMLFAQGSGFFNPFAGLTPPGSVTEPTIETGCWTLYKMQNFDDSGPGKMKLSVVGSEKRDDKDCYWFEFEVWDNEGNHDIFKYLVRGNLTDKQTGDFSIVTKHNDDPAYEIEFDIPEDEMEPPPPPPGGNTKPEDDTEIPETYMSNEDDEYKVDEQTITTPAGTFKCTHHTFIDKESGNKTELWSNEKIPITSIVKMSGPDGSLVLDEYGTSGAQSAITETPQKMNLNNMFQQMMQDEAEESADKATEKAVDGMIEGGIKSIFGR